VAALLWVAACAARPPGGAAAADTSQAAVTARAPAPFAYHFNRNALAAAVHVPGGDLLAITDTGNVLLFDAGTFAPRAERVPRSPVACLGPATAAGVIAGLEDGRIVEVAVPSLAMKPVGRVDGTPVWIARSPTGMLLIAHGLEPEAPATWRARSIAALTLEELGAMRSLRLPFVGRAFLADARGRLWIGADRGEWGGRLAMVDLAAWSVREVEPKSGWQGIYGFTETPDGHIWAYGGTMHMGGRGSFIAAIDREPSVKLFEARFARTPAPDRPSLPITNVVPLPGGRSFLVLAYEQAYEVDAALAAWRPLPRFQAHYTPGRPDAVGVYPAVKAVQVIGESPRRIAIATGLDGWVELRGDEFVAHRIAGQIGSSNIERVDDWAGRIVARAGHLDGGAWALGPDGWAEIEAASPVALPETTRLKRAPAAAFLPRPDGKLLAAFRDDPNNWHNGKLVTLVTALCDGARCEAIGQEQSLVMPEGMFVTPDGGAWALDDFGLWNFRERRWVLALPHGPDDRRSPLPGTGRILGVVPTAGPPWVLRGRDEVALLSPGTAAAAPRMTIAVHGGAMPFVESIDVAACAGRIYVARRGGVCELDVGSGTCARTLQLRATGDVRNVRSIRHVGCDRGGHLWLGGEGLWKVDGGAVSEVNDLDALVAGHEITAIGRDTGAGLPVAIQGRGIAVLSAPGAPLPSSSSADEGDRSFSPPPRQAVFVVFKRSEEASGLIEPIDEALHASRAGAFAGFARRPGGDVRLIFYGPDAGKMVDVMRGVFARLGRGAVVFRRDGELGTPEQRIDIAPR
jgi:hypothetical protein